MDLELRQDRDGGYRLFRKKSGCSCGTIITILFILGLIGMCGKSGKSSSYNSNQPSQYDRSERSDSEEKNEESEDEVQMSSIAFEENLDNHENDSDVPPHSINHNDENMHNEREVIDGDNNKEVYLSHEEDDHVSSYDNDSIQNEHDVIDGDRKNMLKNTIND